jgi:hypothetical protein
MRHFDLMNNGPWILLLLGLVSLAVLWFDSPPKRVPDTTKTLESRQGQIRLRSVEILEHIEGLGQSVS